MIATFFASAALIGLVGLAWLFPKDLPKILGTQLFIISLGCAAILVVG